MAAHLVAGNNAANRRRDDCREFLLDLVAHFLGEGSAKLRGPLGILENQGLLQEHVRVKARRKNEMALEKRAGSFEFVQDLLVRHSNSFKPGRARREEQSHFEMYAGQTKSRRTLFFAHAIDRFDRCIHA